jgi:hypothetical protein
MQAKKITPEELEKIEREYREVEASIPDDPEMPQEEEPTIIDTPATVVEEIKPEEIKPVVENIQDNGHSPAAVVDIEDKRSTRLKEIEAMQKARDQEHKKDMPGYGYLIGAEDELLDEMTILNTREVLLFAVGDTKDEMINPDRTEGIAKIFRRRIKKYKISDQARGRDDMIDARQAFIEQYHLIQKSYLLCLIRQ